MLELVDLVMEFGLLMITQLELSLILKQQDLIHGLIE